MGFKTLMGGCVEEDSKASCAETAPCEFTQRHIVRGRVAVHDLPIRPSNRKRGGRAGPWGAFRSGDLRNYLLATRIDSAGAGHDAARVLPPLAT